MKTKLYMKFATRHNYLCSHFLVVQVYQLRKRCESEGIYEAEFSHCRSACDKTLA